MRGLKWIVVRGPSTNSSYDEADGLAIDSAQEILDLISTNVGIHLVLSEAEIERLVWWPENEQLSIRFVSISTMLFDAGAAKLTVGGAASQDSSSSSNVSSQWHESFRYYRLSQTTSDLFDAYRNSYLALESILSDLAPQKLNAGGKPNEGEGVWFKRALGVVDAQFGLSQWVPASTPDPVEYLYSRFYAGTRSAVSHAKSGRKVLLPQSLTDRIEVVDGLQQVISVYQGIAAQWLGVRWPGGWMSPAAREVSLRAVYAGLEMYASDDSAPFSSSDDSPNPTGGSLCAMSAIGAPDLLEDGTLRQVWMSEVDGLRALPVVRRAVATKDGKAHVTNVLEQPLLLGNARKFEVDMGSRIVGARTPRGAYPY